MEIFNGIAKNASSIDFVGTGLSAVIFRVYSKQKTVFIVRWRFSYAEIVNTQTAAIINKYREQTPLFIRTYNQFVSTDVPVEFIPTSLVDINSGILQDLKQLKNGRHPTKVIMVEILEDGGTEMAQDPFGGEIDVYDVTCMIFDFFFGFYVARVTSGSFSHNDVHERNLSISIRKEPQRRYYVGDVEFVLNSRFQLHLLDYDTVTWPENTKTSMDIRSGLSALKGISPIGDRTALRNFLSSFSPNSLLARLDNVHETETFVEILTTHDFFKSIRIDTERKKIKTCVQCFNFAQYALQKNHNICFCSHQCNNQYHVGYRIKSSE